MGIDYAGRRIGNYQLERLIGQGGFASVHLGRHIYLGNQAAIKIMPTSLTKENRALFLQEAQMLARLDHPGIIRVLEFGIDEQGEATYLAMQYASQGTIRQRYPRGSRLSLAIVRAYVERIASALHYAHESKIIHRDVKPENLLLSKEETVLLSDFGIAVVASSARLNTDKENIAGTLSYIAPEQLQGSPCAASDQYALGVVIYEWLCGRTPFRGSSTEIMAKHLFATPPSMRELLPNVPEELEQVIMRALAKQPEQRFVSVKEFSKAFLHASVGVRLVPVGPEARENQALADYGTVFGQSFTERPVSRSIPSSEPAVAQQAALLLQKPYVPEAGNKARPTRRRLLASGIGLAAALAAGGVGGLWYWRERDTSTGLTTKGLLTGTPTEDMVTIYRRARLSVNEALWLPESKRVLTLLDDSDIYAWDIESGAHEQLIFPSVKYQGQVLLKGSAPIGLSSDGKQLALVTTAGVLTGSLGADTYDMLTNPEELSALWWSPRGSILALATARGLELWDTRTRKMVYTNDLGISSSSSDIGRMIGWSPDGRALASISSDYTSVLIWSAEVGRYGERIATLGRAGRVAQTLAWSPDGKQIVISWQGESPQVWDIASHAPLFTCEQVLLGPDIVSWSPDGSYVLGGGDALGKDTNLYVWNMRKGQGKNPGSLVKTYKGHQQTILTASWSPDSRYIISGSGRGEGPGTQAIDASARIWRAPT